MKKTIVSTNRPMLWIGALVMGAVWGVLGIAGSALPIDSRINLDASPRYCGILRSIVCTGQCRCRG